jgi:FkbM family methyltransferase
MLGIEASARHYWRNGYALYRSWRGRRYYRRIARTISNDIFCVTIAGREFRFLTVDDFSKFHFFKTAGAPSGAIREEGLTRELTRLLPQSRCFADVGANVGYYSCIAAGLNPDLDICAFELDSLNVARMRQNIALNECRNIELVHAAVTDRGGEVTYERPPENDAMPCSTLTIAPPLFDRIAERRERVRAITLDEFFLARGILPDLVKIDVEGAEVEVLRGMEVIIRRARPTIFVEVHGVALPRFGHSPTDVVTFLRRHDYALYHVEDHRSGGNTAVLPLAAERSHDDLVLVIARPIPA